MAVRPQFHDVRPLQSRFTHTNQLLTGKCLHNIVTALETAAIPKGTWNERHQFPLTSARNHAAR
jgi:hypothetical protein